MVILRFCQDTAITVRHLAWEKPILYWMNGTCHVLATTWEWEEDIDTERAEDARKRAEARLAEGGLSDKEYRIVKAKLQRALVRLGVKE